MKQLTNEKPAKNSTTGFKGVSCDKRTGKYQSEIKLRTCRVYCGTFDTVKEAYEARQKEINKMIEELKAKLEKKDGTNNDN